MRWDSAIFDGSAGLEKSFTKVLSESPRAVPLGGLWLYVVL
jgi:hypothetical protein